MWTLSASRRPIVCRLLNVLCGCSLLVSFVLCLLALRIPVVTLFFSALPYLFIILDLILLVAFSNARFLFKTRPFGDVQCSMFTWTRWNGTLASRIDLIGIPYVWVPYVESCGILPCPFSDHCAVLSFILVPDVVPPGPGFWNLNTSILQDDEYVKLI